ncbi:MAG: hypothetical protein J0I14_10740 [Propionibacteriaceae bacterium]|nr:hypothetical protein [Propionibacteriaceae bacterium]
MATLTAPDGATLTRSVSASTALSQEPWLSVSGTPKLGATLSVVTGGAGWKLWSVAWTLDGKVQPHTSYRKPSITLTDYRVLNKTLAVTATMVRGATTRSFSVPVGKVQLGTLTVVGTPTISGTPAAGKKLVVKGIKFSPTASLSYRWYLNDHVVSKKAIKGHSASWSWITVPKGWKGKDLSVRVTGSRYGYAALAVDSAEVTVTK